MKLEFDTLKCVKILKEQKFNPQDAEILVSALSGVEIRNLYHKGEVDIMQSDAVEKVFKRWDEKQALIKQELERRIASYEGRLANDIAEARAGRRWVIGTIVTVGVALAGYLSALIHFSH